MLIPQVGHEELLELQAGIAEMALDGAFGASDFCGNGFDGHFVVVVEQKDASAGGGECRQGCLKVLPEFCEFRVTTRTWDGLGDAVFVNEMQWFGVILLSTEMVGADVFSNPIQPRIESGIAPETADGAKCPKPRLLRQVLGEFRVCDTTVYVGIQTLLIFSHQRGKRFSVSGLGKCNEVFFVKGSGQGVFTSVKFGSAPVYLGNTRSGTLCYGASLSTRRQLL